MALVRLSDSAPPPFKILKHYIKFAADHVTRDPAVTYYALMHCVNAGSNINKTDKDCRAFLLKLLDELESLKSAHKDNESIQSMVVGHAAIENYALKLFTHADNEDRAGNFTNIKNITKQFYTSGILFDVLEVFEGGITEEVSSQRKYAKWKAAYLNRCMKTGQIPVAGPLEGQEEESDAIPFLMGSEQPAALPPSQPIQRPAQNSGPPPPPPSGPVVTPQAAPSQPASGCSAEAIKAAMKYSKFATSALQYDDTTTAITNLHKALNLLTTGHE